MKRLSRTLKVVLVMAVGALVVFAYRAVGQDQTESNSRYAAKTYELRLKDAKFKNQDEKAFNAALQKFADDQMDLTVTEKDGKSKRYPPRPSAMKIDKVTTSAVAQQVAAGQLTPIGINVVTKVTSSSTQDLKNVLDTLE